MLIRVGKLQFVDHSGRGLVARAPSGLQLQFTHTNQHRPSLLCLFILIRCYSHNALKHTREVLRILKS